MKGQHGAAVTYAAPRFFASLRMTNKFFRGARMTKLIECCYCKAKVAAKVIASHDDSCQDDPPFRVYLLECPSCKNSLIGGVDLLSDDAEDAPTRLWPQPRKYRTLTIPSIVATSLDEAERCFESAAYTACVAMCGRALEGICRHFKTKSRYIGEGIKELKSKEIIDSRLYKWSEELHSHRNMAAHATDENITKEDARDLLDFTAAICDYVFVLTDKFNRFMKRKRALKKSKKEKSIF